MNNRRSFFKSLVGLIVAPKVAEALPTEAPMRRLRANWSIEVEQDLDAMLLTNMSKAIQEEIDNDMIKKLTEITKMGS